MANVKITELGALASAASADLVPVVDVTDDTTKKATAGQIVSVISGDVTVADDGTATISELPVSKLQDGSAGQIVQTDSAGTGVEWSSTANLPLGSEGAPAYRFQGDLNTGIYSPGADQVAISTNGAGRLFVDASGNIGIGTSSPGQKLHSASSASAALLLQRTGALSESYGSGVIFGTDFSNNGSYIQGLGNGAIRFGSVTDITLDSPFAEANGGVELMRIDGSGNVGVGAASLSHAFEVATGSTTSGATVAALIKGNSTAGRSVLLLGDTTNDFVQHIVSDHESNSLTFHTGAVSIGDNERARIDSSGRLLVGTSSSAGNAKLEVTETRRLSATQNGSGWLELTDSAAVTSGALTDIATATLSNVNSCYFRLEVLAGHTDINGGYSQAVSIREGLIGNYASSPRVNNNTETRNLSGSVSAGTIATAVSTDVVTGASGVNSTFTFRATVTMSGASGAGTSPRLSYRLSLFSTSSNAVTAVSAI